ncbi:hypothetical protein BDR07DRAFT_1377215 [Suillus spraguei]|nr:hypothetical protein BDR07DRAFT_1377215 [Suillus spraguei]
MWRSSPQCILHSKALWPRCFLFGLVSPSGPRAAHVLDKNTLKSLQDSAVLSCRLIRGAEICGDLPEPATSDRTVCVMILNMMEPPFDVKIATVYGPLYTKCYAFMKYEISLTRGSLYRWSAQVITLVAEAALWRLLAISFDLECPWRYTVRGLSKEHYSREEIVRFIITNMENSARAGRRRKEFTGLAGQTG